MKTGTKTRVGQWMFVAAAFLYFVGNLGTILALQAGAINHAVFSPVEILRFLAFCSFSILILAPVLWWLFLRAHITGRALILILAVIGATFAMDLSSYWLAVAAV